MPLLRDDLPPQHNLRDALSHALDNPDATHADVTFIFESPEDRCLAHRALIHARTTPQFRADYLPDLDNDPQTPATISLAPCHIQPEQFRLVLRYWYTGILENVTQVLSTDFGVAALARLQRDTDLYNATVVEDHPMVQLQRENSHELARSVWSVWLAEDLSKLWPDGRFSDIELTLLPNSRPSSPKPSSSKAPLKKSEGSEGSQPPPPPPPPVSYRAHKFLLSAQSPYFAAMFSSFFVESQASTIVLSRDIFNPTILPFVLQFMYTGHLRLPPLASTMAIPIKSRLVLLERLYLAGDYLSMPTTLCVHVMHHMISLGHGLSRCRCNRCQYILPHMFALADRHQQIGTTDLREACLQILSDPVYGIHLTWPHRAIAELDTSLREVILSGAIERITATNAVDAMKSAYDCSLILNSQMTSSWTNILTSTMLEPVLSHISGLVAANFDMYALNPSTSTLLKSVDGADFSCDFLDFLLARLVECLNDAIAGKVYQAIVRDLMNREAVSENSAVKRTLDKAREDCAAYVKRRWVGVKAAGGLVRVEEDVVKKLSMDTLIPFDTLNESMGTAPSNLFLFNGFTSRPVRTTRDKGPAKSLVHSRSSGELASVSAARSASTTAGNSSTSSSRRTPATSSSRSQQRQAPPPTTPASSPRASQPRRVVANTSTNRSLPTVASSSHPPTRQSTGRGRSQPRAEQPIVQLVVGDRVQLPRKGVDVLGTVRFIGEVRFAEGTWVGVEMNTGGRNDGSVQGVRYFDVPDQRGLFVRSADVVRVME